MRFKVSRTSSYREGEKPFPHAKGINGKWTVEINDLAELIDFINKYGKIVMFPDYIEIYDDYRE